jgi:hypothetical protein
MTLAKIEHGALIPIYGDTGESVGFYRILPGYPSYICLNEKLLEGSEETHQFVYQTLVDYHNSIPLDSRQRVFKHVRYFEELKRLPVAEPQPEIIIIGRAIRVWRFMQDGDKVRIIGKAAS